MNSELNSSWRAIIKYRGEVTKDWGAGVKEIRSTLIGVKIKKTDWGGG